MKRKETITEEWLCKYSLLRDYIGEHGQLPDKKKVENRGLLNWWKYNQKRIRAGKMSSEKTEMLNKLSLMRKIHR